MQLRLAGTRATAVLLQQSDGRLPEVRRPRPDPVLRPGARRRLSPPLAGRRRDQGLGPAQPVLLPDAGVIGRALRHRHQCSLRKAARGNDRHRALRLGQGADPVQVPQREGHPLRPQPCLRGHHPQPRAPLPRDRLDGGARGAVEIPQQQALPRLRRHAPAPRGAPRLRRRPEHLGPQSPVADQLPRLLQPAATDRAEGPGRREDTQGNHRAAVLPDQRRARLPLARPLGGNALGRRGAAHPPGLADRLGPHRRHVRARRTLDRPAPARQRAPAGNPGPPARPGQHGDRGRARPRSHRIRRLRGGHGPRRRRARRSRGRGRHASAGGGQHGFGHRRLPRRPARDRHTRQTHAAQRAARTEDSQRRRQQPEAGQPRHSGGPADLRHRRFRLGQVDADQRHALRRRRAPSLRFGGRTGSRTARSRASNSSTR